MPPNTGAFYFYVEPNPFAVHNCSAIATSSTGTASTGGFPVDGDHGARMVGFHDPAGIISKIDVSCSADFATGEYGWAPGGAPPAGLVCDIQVNKTTSTVGVQIQVKNPGTTPVPAEFKIFVVLPSGPPASFLRTELTLLPGFDTGVLPLVSFPTSGLPAGPYEFNCRIVNPTTGAQLVFDQNPFTLP